VAEYPGRRGKRARRQPENWIQLESFLLFRSDVGGRNPNQKVPATAGTGRHQIVCRFHALNESSGKHFPRDPDPVKPRDTFLNPEYLDVQPVTERGGNAYFEPACDQ
jgi:hypothetical protein